MDKVNVIAEREDFIVAEKPAGVLVHPTQAGEKDTMIDFVLKRCPEIKKVVGFHPPLTPPLAGWEFNRPGIVHRLDKEASGLLVIARTQKMFEHLKKQFQERTIGKEYLVLVYGKIDKECGVIDFQLDRSKSGRMVARPKIKEINLATISSVQQGKDARTEFDVEGVAGRFTLLRVKTRTGRTHQIRVHLFAYNHPVVGDTLYCNKKLIKKNQPELNRLFLHLAKLCFDDLDGRRLCFESELPDELKAFLKSIGYLRLRDS